VSAGTQAVLQATAYHEAAHAVAFFQLGISSTRVTIVPTDEDEGSASHARFNFWPPEGHLTPERRDRIERKIIAALAGAVAEERFTGRECSAGAGHDHAIVVELALRVCGGERETNAYVAWLMTRTEMLVAQR